MTVIHVERQIFILSQSCTFIHICRSRRLLSPSGHCYTVSLDHHIKTCGEAVSVVSREQAVSVVKSYTYDDCCEACGTDTFNREPFVVMFTSKSTYKPWKKGTCLYLPSDTSDVDFLIYLMVSWGLSHSKVIRSAGHQHPFKNKVIL